MQFSCMFPDMYVYTRVYIYIYMHIHTCNSYRHKHKYMLLKLARQHTQSQHTYIHTYMHTYIHTYISLQSQITPGAQTMHTSRGKSCCDANASDMHGRSHAYFQVVDSVYRIYESPDYDFCGCYWGAICKMGMGSLKESVSVCVYAS